MDNSITLINETPLSNQESSPSSTNSESSQVLATADIIAIGTGITLAFLTIALVWLTWVLIKLTKQLVFFARNLDKVSENTLKTSEQIQELLIIQGSDRASQRKINEEVERDAEKGYKTNKKD